GLRTFRQVRLDLRLLALLCPFRLLLVAGEVGPDPRNEGNALAVGKPAQSLGAGGDRRQPPRFAAVRSNHIHLRLLVVLALGGERDPFAIRRPAWLAVLVPGGQPLRSAAVGGEQPELRQLAVLLHVVGGHRGAGKTAVGRQRGRTDALDRPEIFDTEWTFASRHGDSVNGIEGTGGSWPRGASGGLYSDRERPRRCGKIGST